MGVFVRHEACPRCGSRNNVGVYEDGSKWCFGCHWWQPPDAWNFKPVKKGKPEHDDIQLDDDLCFDYPRHVVEWLAKYGISVHEAIKHGWKYAPFRDQLVFIFADAEGNIACTQARNFSPTAKRKYFNQGSAQSVLPIFRSKDGEIRESTERTVVVVEDAVSAAKIARQSDAIPCLGSYMSKSKLNALRLLGYEQMVVWLDENKLKESREIAEQAKWIGFTTKVVYTPLDPKEYSDEEIRENLSTPNG